MPAGGAAPPSPHLFGRPFVNPPDVSKKRGEDIARARVAAAHNQRLAAAAD
jgi:hypothetical protein